MNSTPILVPPSSYSRYTCFHNPVHVDHVIICEELTSLVVLTVRADAEHAERTTRHSLPPPWSHSRWGSRDSPTYLVDALRRDIHIGRPHIVHLYVVAPIHITVCLRLLLPALLHTSSSAYARNISITVNAPRCSYSLRLCWQWFGRVSSRQGKVKTTEGLASQCLGMIADYKLHMCGEEIHYFGHIPRTLFREL